MRNPRLAVVSAAATLFLLVGASPSATEAVAHRKIVHRVCWGREVSIQGNPQDDTIIGTQFTDVIKGGRGSDVIFGGAGRDFICGNQGRDSIVGGDGTDRVDGGRGVDTCEGEHQRRCESL